MSDYIHFDDALSYDVLTFFHFDPLSVELVKIPPFNTGHRSPPPLPPPMLPRLTLHDPRSPHSDKSNTSFIPPIKSYEQSSFT